MTSDEKKSIYNHWVYANSARMNADADFKAEVQARKKKYFEDEQPLDQDVIDMGNAMRAHLRANDGAGNMKSRNQWS